MYKDSLAQLPPQQIYRQKTHWLNVDLTGIIDIRPTGSVLNKKAHWLGADLTRTLDRRPTGVGQISLDFSTKDPLAQFRSQQNYQQKTHWLGGDLVGTMDKTHLLMQFRLHWTYRQERAYLARTIENIPIGPVGLPRKEPLAWGRSR